jgi:hypothetical protein
VVRVSIEVRSGTDCFKVRIQASDIQRAVSLVQSFYSACDVRIIFPIDPEAFFVQDAFAKEGLIEGGRPQEELAA